MGRNQKIIATALWGALVLVMVGVVVGQFWLPRRDATGTRTGGTDALPVYFPAGSFQLVDENGKPFSDRDLQGHPWVASMIFTNCGDVCPMMTARMSRLQGQTPPAVQLVSFTVDPERDTPAVLKDYASRYGADESRWHFLTGTKQQIADVAASLKLSLQAATSSAPILHSDRFLLVDGHGDVRGIYSGKDEDELKKLAADAKALAAPALAAGGGRGGSR